MPRSYPELHRRWMEACRVPFTRFATAKGRCYETQAEILQAILRRNAGTIFGQQHNFKNILSIDDFRKFVPLANYDDFRPYIASIQRGEARVLTVEPVTNLHLSSGTAQGSKLLPFTTDLHHGFQAGIQPWLYDLYTRFPLLKQGAFYWIVTPMGVSPPTSQFQVPVGFADDADYLDPVGRQIFPRVSAAPPAASTAAEPEQFYQRTWAALLENPHLAMISFWSPRFFLELLQRLPNCAEASLGQMHSTGNRNRVVELQRIFAAGFDSVGLGRKLWPGLSLISCWTDGWASLFLEDTRRFFDGVPIQGKGLLSTEGIVSVPLGDQPGSVLAVRSHFFEFESESGHCFLPHELIEGREYQVVLTTQGGLYRYRLGDIVRVVGWESDIPRVEFISKTGRVVDLCGEKLDEAHVNRILSTALKRRGQVPAVCFLAPQINRRSAGYVLALDDSYSGDLFSLRQEVETGLQENFYYRNGRQLGQLTALQVQRLNPKAIESYKSKKGRSGLWSTAKLSFLETEINAATPSEI